MVAEKGDFESGLRLHKHILAFIGAQRITLLLPDPAEIVVVQRSTAFDSAPRAHMRYVFNPVQRVDDCVCGRLFSAKVPPHVAHRAHGVTVRRGRIPAPDERAEPEREHTVHPQVDELMRATGESKPRNIVELPARLLQVDVLQEEDEISSLHIYDGCIACEIEGDSPPVTTSVWKALTAEPTFIDFSILLDILSKVVTKSEGGIRRTLGIMLHVGVGLCRGDAIVRLRLRRCKVHYASGFDASDGAEETVSIRMAHSRKWSYGSQVRSHDILCDRA